MAIPRGKYRETKLDIRGGLDDYTRAIALDDAGYSLLQNVNLRRWPTLSSRNGLALYDDKSRAITDNVKNMHRYRKRDGTSKIAIYTDGDDVYVDDDAGVFEAAIDTTRTTNDGFLSFVQWQDVLLYGNEKNPWRMYNDGESSEVILFDRLSGALGYNALVHTDATSGGVLKDQIYAWRFTFSHYHGDTFIGESHPIWSGIASYRDGDVGEKPWQIRSNDYVQHAVTWGTTTNKMTISVVNDGRTADTDWGATAKYLNVYRSLAPLGATPDVEDREQDMWFMGQIAAEDYDAAQAIAPQDGLTSTDLFVDDGRIEARHQIDYGAGAFSQPQARYGVAHKNRLFVGHVYIPNAPNPSRSITHADWVMWSEAGKPSDIRLLSVKPATQNGAGITGMFSFFNRELMVFSENETMALIGGDDDTPLGAPQLYVDFIDKGKGCIAPQTITPVPGGVAWLSAAGPVAYDGREVQVMREEKVREYFGAIPKARKYHAVGAYDARNQEYSIFHTPSGGSYNTYASTFSFRTGLWTRSLYQTGIGAS